ncbi:MAG: hypothetical protein JSS74_09080 [Actinobacteria bacterium]|nr:hypothetical protein [Actinomycetota bacterium]
MTELIVWTKPSCVQCDAVKRRVVGRITGKTGLTGAQVKAAFLELVIAGVVTERDLTAPENARDLDYFRGLGYVSAPITEYGGSAVPGYMPTELDQILDRWLADHPAEVAP